MGGSIRTGIDWPRRISLWASIDWDKHEELNELLEKGFAERVNNYKNHLHKRIDDMFMLHSLHSDLISVGFGLDQFSPHAYSITAVPVQLGTENPVEALQQVIHQVQDAGSNAKQEWHKAIAIALADKMAIPVGKTLSEIEMRDLLMQLVEKHPAQYLNNGQNIFTILTQDEIQKRF